jgi:hypothetical protein
MAQRKHDLFTTGSVIGRLGEQAREAMLEGKSLPRSRDKQRKGFQWGQYTEDARALLRLINLATGRESDLQGSHFHVWDAKQTKDITVNLRAFIQGMELALVLPKGQPKKREKMHRELYQFANTEVNRIWNETGVDYQNDGSWASCPIPFASCAKSLVAIQCDTPEK